VANPDPIVEGASFRDPSGFVFRREGLIYRQVNQSYQDHYDRLIESGLYARLVQEGLLIPHQEAGVEPADPVRAYKVLQPDQVPFISYPYEWCFSQLKDAALATLAVQKMALEAGMWLKDASAYNVQFYRGRPVLIDTLSFEIYPEGQPWVAYRQFCQHFLAPLALISYRDVRLSQLMRVYIDGLPLDLASGLLPARTRLNFGLATHLHLHASAQRRYSDQAGKTPPITGTMGKTAVLGLIDSLEGTVRSLKWKPAGTEWGAYYSDTNYTPTAFEHKHRIVQDFLSKAQPQTVWDLGANTGLFSRLASEMGGLTLAFDIDPAAVELNYRECRKKEETHLLPLWIDLTNPSPALGWANQERRGLLERGPVDLVMALALVHHLAISNNVPLDRLAGFFSGLSRWLVIEFIPKSDSQVRRLLASRQDIFPEYHAEGFERAFKRSFTIHACIRIPESERTLYLMESHLSAHA